MSIFSFEAVFILSSLLETPKPTQYNLLYYTATFFVCMKTTF